MHASQIDGQEVIRQVYGSLPDGTEPEVVKMGKNGARLVLKFGGRRKEVARCNTGDTQLLVSRALDKLPRMTFGHA